jgi:hypothetical protein
MPSPQFNHLIFKTLSFALLALVSACGGGGASPPALRFEQITLGAVAAVRDNSTNLIWATQPAVNEQSPGFSPSLQELLTLTDAGKDAIAENFPTLVLNQEIQSNESRMTLPWLVSFSPSNLGEVRDGEPLAGAPFSSLRVLDRAKYTPPRFFRDELTPHVVFQGNLMWDLCTHGTTYDPIHDVCKGVPEALDFNQAKELALKLSKERYGGYYGWRLPTKQELQKMLNLSNAKDSLLAAPFSSLEGKTLNDWSSSQPERPGLVYWTTSTHADPTDPKERFWVVDFKNDTDLGGVHRTYLDSPVTGNFIFLVRLVRNVP